MEKSIAVKKLGKILGKGFGYRVNPKAPSKEEREAARVAEKAARAEKDRLNSELENRRREVLAGDQEFQQRLVAYQAARKRWGMLSSASHHYRVTVGNVTSHGFFFIKAQGDNWEEVVEKVTNGKE